MSPRDQINFSIAFKKSRYDFLDKIAKKRIDLAKQAESLNISKDWVEKNILRINPPE